MWPHRAAFLQTLGEGIKIRKWAKQVFLDRVRLCGGSMYILPSPAWALPSSALGCCSQKRDVAERCSSGGGCGRPHSGAPGLCRGPAFSQGRVWRPLAPQSTCAQTLGRGVGVGGGDVCYWRSFLYPPYSKEKLGPV